MKTKVKDLAYKRYTIEEGRLAFEKFAAAMREAKCEGCVIAAREAFLNEMDHYSTAASLSNCRFTLDTRDEFYQAEMAYYDEVGPEFSDIITKYADLMLNSKFREALEKKLGKKLFLEYEVQKKSFSPIVVEECKKENALVTEYSKFMSEMTFLYNGERVPLTVLRGKLTDSDRRVRKAAAEAIGKGLSENSKELDRIYDELVKIRTEIARKMGYKNFVELGYYRMGRTGYGREMVESFRANVARDLVPAVAALKSKIAKKLGLDKIMFYDNDVYTVGEEPKPVLDVKGIFDTAEEMYYDISTVTGDFMHSMREAEAFDVESREGKWGGGYCTAFPDYKQPFILANFNGTASDLDVITHEFGHALASHFVFNGGDRELGIGGMETAECHSMSMEFFAYPYAEKFCGDLAQKYKLKHLLSALSFIPYGVIVDEFQHEVYEHPEYTPEERKALYRRLEEKYRPYISYEDIPYLCEGTRWQYQMHIYESPFYYIDYCLAQTVAFGFFVKSQENFRAAVDAYLEFVKKGGTEPFEQLVEEAGITSPFKDGALSDVVIKILKFVEKLEAEI